jgi:hypothetical protein
MGNAVETISSPQYTHAVGLFETTSWSKMTMEATAVQGFCFSLYLSLLH